MWDFEMKILFRTKDLMEIVDGTCTLQKQDEDKKKRCLTINTKAQHIVLLTVKNQVKHNILICKTAKEIYNTLKKIYKLDSIQQKFSLL